MSQIHLLCTVYMAGVINVIHWVHYPVFPQIAPNRFLDFTKQHSRRMQWIVFPVMLAELLSSWAQGPFVATATTLNFLGTFVLFVPIHRNFERLGFNEDSFKKLMRWNVFRLVFWNAKAAFLLWSAI